MGVFGPGPSIIDAGFAAAEGIDRIREYVERDDPDTLTDQELQQWAEDNGFNYRKEDGVTYLTLQTEEAEQAIDQSLYDSSDFPIERRMLEPGSDTPAPESNNTMSSKSNGTTDEGGENNMTDEEYDNVPMTAAHAVAYESHKNLDEHEEVADDELYNLDLSEQVALGTAAVMKGIEEEQYDDFGLVELDEFIDQYGEEFNDEDFKRYKGQMGGNQYDLDHPEKVEDEVDEINRIKQSLGTDTVLWEALYREKAADNEESQEVLEGVLKEVQELDRDDSRLQSSRQGLQHAENTERAQSQKADDIDDLARNL